VFDIITQALHRQHSFPLLCAQAGDATALATLVLPMACDADVLRNCPEPFGRFVDAVLDRFSDGDWEQALERMVCEVPQTLPGLVGENGDPHRWCLLCEFVTSRTSSPRGFSFATALAMVALGVHLVPTDVCNWVAMAHQVSVLVAAGAAKTRSQSDELFAPIAQLLTNFDRKRQQENWDYHRMHGIVYLLDFVLIGLAPRLDGVSMRRFGVWLKRTHDSVPKDMRAAVRSFNMLMLLLTNKYKPLEKQAGEKQQTLTSMFAQDT
jgi:hypothetical protein